MLKLFALKSKNGVPKSGGIPKWPTGADCKSVVVRLRRFESCSPHQVELKVFKVLLVFRVFEIQGTLSTQ
jgi:hypothetical protein